MTETINKTISVEQFGFRTNRSDCDQVSSLTAINEDSLEKKLKSVVAFIDLRQVIIQ